MILGATGFIGKNIALYFSKKFKIKATYNKRVPFKNNNIKWIKCNLKIQNKLIIFLIILILSLMLQL